MGFYIEKLTIRERLKRQGYLVTQTKWGGWDNCNKMVVKLNGEEVGFMTPNQCLKFVKELEDEYKTKARRNY